MRITLRPPAHGDVDAIWRNLQDAETVQWLTTLPFPYQRSDAVAFVDQIATPDDMAIIADGEFAGVIRVRGEIGYWIAPPLRRRGIARRALQIALFRHFAASDDPVRANHLDGNIASRALLEGVGFRETGAGQVTRRFDGRSVPQRHMELTRSAFVAALSIRTPRGLLTPMTEADFPALHRIATEPATARMLMRFFPGQTGAEFARIMRPAMDPVTRPVRLAIRRDGRCIGSIGVDAGADPAVFYFLAPEAAGQGIASEVLPVFCDAVQDWFDLDTLTAQVFADNAASRRVLEKAGFAAGETRLLVSAGRARPETGLVMRRG
ncbi:Protein N-acetyltransferase, RimJ/RimL family [Paracoccus isoporae]|uniref:Protein N-acetyltransferase, RimJ/RimL family n=1 Tax=Paracoccus isoporae TaxID=591205 RepID=A0A1G7BBW0_9RHOB|nr:GNAT family N-acetyltransferase [Paracoccus isoporae]SDE24452.1 Protein N-acetyltransferase, RimJ/RimL family [Paracoccus isoporae]